MIKKYLYLILVFLFACEDRSSSNEKQLELLSVALNQVEGSCLDFNPINQKFTNKLIDSIFSTFLDVADNYEEYRLNLDEEVINSLNTIFCSDKEVENDVFFSNPLFFKDSTIAMICVERKNEKCFNDKIGEIYCGEIYRFKLDEGIKKWSFYSINPYSDFIDVKK